PAARRRPHELAQPVRVPRRAVRREAHDLVLAVVDRETEVRRERRVQQAERMRELDLLEELERGAVAEAVRRGRPLADAVDGEQRRAWKSRKEKRAGGVALMVIEVKQRRVHAEPLADRALLERGIERGATTGPELPRQ